MVTRRRFLGGIVALAVVGRDEGGARASVARSVSLGELLYESKFVVLGEVTRASARWERVGGRACIVTYSVFRTEESLGERAPETSDIVIRSLGGSVGNRSQVFHGEAVVALSERAVVFLRDAGPSAFAVTAMAQGYYSVRKDEKGAARLRAAFESVSIEGPGETAMQRLDGRTVSEVEGMLADEVARARR